MNKLKHLFLMFAVAILLFACSISAFAADVTTVNATFTYGQTEARTILSMINEMRTSSEDAWYWNSDNSTKTTCSNLSELKYDYDLERIAMKRAAEIAMSYSHTRPNGSSCWTCYTEENVSWSSVGENIAVGQKTAVDVNKGWREDDKNYSGQGHRRNMLDSSYNSVGIGHVYYNGTHYWVEEFAKKTINDTETVANDSATKVDVQIADSNITSLNVVFDKTSYSVCKDDSITPIVKNVSIKVSGSWPSSARPINNTPILESSDPSVAKVVDGTIKGISVGTCNMTATVCGKTVSVPVAVESCDDYYEKKAKKNATCTADGSITYLCTRCGKTYSESIPALGHVEMIIPSVKATCTESGLSEGIRCLRCEEVLVKQEKVDETGHNYVGGTCTVCGDRIIIEQNGLKFVEIISESGKKAVELICVETEAIDTEGNVVIPETIKIDDVQYTVTSIATSAISSSAKTVTVPDSVKTIEENGIPKSAIIICSPGSAAADYAKNNNNTIGCTEHVYGDAVVTKEATAFEEGEKTQTCTVCGTTKTEEIAKLTPTIKLSATKKTIKKKKSYTLKISGLAKGDDVKSVKTSKKAVATVKKVKKNQYKITGKKKGKATITVTLKSGKKATCKITVK